MPASNRPKGRNNFDLARLLLAFSVAAYHSAILSGLKPLHGIITAVDHLWPVHGFFVISGYLIFASWERWRKPGDFAAARVRRIYPAYAVVVLLSGLLLPATGGRLRYLAANLSFLNFAAPTLPGVFEANPVSFVDGSLWSLKIEAMFYCIVPPLAWMLRRGSPALFLAGFYVLSVTYTMTLAALSARPGLGVLLELSRQLPGQMGFFCVGALVHYHRARFQQCLVPLVILALCAVACGALEGFGPLTPFAVGVLTMAFCLGRYLGPWGKYGDFSYGLYLFHYPVIQLLVAGGWIEGRPWLFLTVALSLSLLAGWLSWNLVEKRFLAPRASALIPAADAPAY